MSVTPETPAVVALALMAERGISGVGVVNAKGLLIANFSISDLRRAPAPVGGAARAGVMMLLLSGCRPGCRRLHVIAAAHRVAGRLG